MTRATHTFAIMDLSLAAYQEIRRKIVDAGYDHAFSTVTGDDGMPVEVIDMHGIGVRASGEEGED